jgi:DNA-binding LacI/PurR family transcriptional regulator
LAVSIKNVAEQAGVSAGTVSKVLNQASGFSVPDDTRRRIHRVASQLGYVPNRMARSLGKGRSETIGVIVSGLRNPFFADLVETAEMLAAQAGYHALIEVTPEKSSASIRPGNLSGWPVDGMIVWTNHWVTLHDKSSLRAYDGPIVYLGYPRNDGSDWVAFDLYGGGRDVVEHVFDTGRSKVWYVTPYEVQIPTLIEDRMRAYVDVCRERGVEPHIVATEREEESREMGIELGLSIAALAPADRPEALICHNDIIAVGVYHGLRRAGIRVPDEIALTGFDGSSEGQCLDLPLTSMLTSPSEMCRIALDVLLGRIRGVPAESSARLIRGTLLRGGTT